MQKKRKRTKLECLACGNVFDDDYRKKHETKPHRDKWVKHVGVPTRKSIYSSS